MRKNIPLFGFLFGALMPWAGILIFYVVKVKGMALEMFLKEIFNDSTVAAKILSLCLLANLIPFLIFFNRRWDKAAKGVLIATMLYALVILWFRFV